MPRILARAQPMAHPARPSRAFLLLALLALAGSAAAGGAGRRLMQSDGGQDNCPDGCEANSCVPAATAGGFRCTNCLGNRVVSRDGSCGCRPGLYLVSSTDGNCTACPVGSFCPGGSMTASVGPNGLQSCNFNNATDPNNTETATTWGLTTRGPRSSSRSACVNKPGFFYIRGDASNNPSAQPCPAHSYSNGFRRQPACTPCAKGLKTVDVVIGTSTTWPQARTNVSVCLVESGRFWSLSSGAMRCPRGEWRAGWVAPGDAGSDKCNKCARGCTTVTAGKSSGNDCKVLLPSFQWTNSSGTMTPTQCAQNFTCPGYLNVTSQTESVATTAYVDNGGRFPCPNGLWTRGLGSREDADCQVPPGYFLASPTANVTACAPGSYQTDWLDRTDTRSCTQCGTGVTSEPTEPINVVALNDTGAGVSTVLLVSRSAASCYIEAGQGLVQASGSGSSATPTYRAVNCTGNTFGALNRTYGLDAKPCTSCPAGTSTAAASPSLRSSFGYISPDACAVPAGTGMTGAVALPCAKGTWNDGTTDPADRCKTCPTGTTTASSSSTSSDSCNLLSAGYEYVSPSTIRACSAGTYRDADSTGTNTIFTVSSSVRTPSASLNCTACPFGTTTFGTLLGTTGAVSVAECSVCPAGMGTPTSATPSISNQCAACGGTGASATFGPSWRPANDTACRACPLNTNVYNFYFNGTNNVYSPPNVAPQSATDSSQCFVAFAQVVDANWYLGTSAAPTAGMAACGSLGTEACHASLTACTNACTGNCSYVTYNYASGATQRCFVFTHNTADVNRIAYKIMPTSASRRRSLHAALPKDQGSGVFSWWRAPSAEAANVGVAISAAQPGSGATFVGACLDSCTDNSDCAAVSFTTTGSAAAWSDRVNGCTLRRGTFDITSSWRSLVRTNAAAVTSVAIPTTPCTSCGSGINSEPTEPINVVALNDTGAGVSAVLLVSRSAASCYIEAGQGLVQASGSGSSSTPTYRLVNCTGNTFGAPNRTYGLDAKPCTSCPAGTSTASSTSADLRSSFGYISPEARAVPAGSGMTGAIATLCAKGTWNDGTTAPADRCKTCPTGTTTAGSNSTSSDACNLLSVGYEFLAVSNTVRLCSAGTYRDADTTGSTTIFTMSGATRVYSTSNVTCFSCPFGTTTFNGQLGTTGAVSAAECLVCPQGMGTPTSATPSGINQCAQCGGPSAAAAFGPLWRTANDTACPTNTNVYNFYYNGTNNPYSPPNIAPPSATDSSQCFVAYAQVVDANWYLNNSPSNMTACGAAGTDCHANLTACVGACTLDASCAFLSYNYTGAAGTTRCFFFRHTSGTSEVNRIAYKIMPTSASRRRSLHAALPKDQGSGVFSWWRASTTEAANVGVAISTLTTGSPSAAFVGACLDSCTDNSDCAAVSFTATGTGSWVTTVSACSLRRGTFDITSSWRSLVRTNAAAALRARARAAAAAHRPAAAAPAEVPPGYYLPSPSVNVTVCATGTYQTDWLDRTDTRSCTSCGSGINSEPTEPINVVALNDTGAGVSAVLLVSRSAASCYIEAGQGLVQVSGSGGGGSAPTYRLVNCTGNTFGAPNRTYGLDAKPCTSCPAGTSTASSISADLRSSFGYISPEACAVPAGSGMTGAIATLCAKGTWNDGTTAPADRCKTCPTGTTTAGSNSTSSDACNLLSVGYEFLAVSNTVRPCSAGTYRDADSTGTNTIFTGSGASRTPSASMNCTTCPGGGTTFNTQLGTTGAISLAECSVCPQGMGTPSSGAPSLSNVCTACGSTAATFGPSWRPANDTACRACPTNTNVYNFYFNGTNNPYSPPNVAPALATDSSQCFVAFAQVVDANWFLGTNATTGMAACGAAGTESCHANLTACAGACTGNCAFLSYNYAAGTTQRCFYFTHGSTTDVNRIAYKIMPTSASRRRSLQAALPKDQGSGVFSWWRASTTEAANVGVVISTLTTGSPSAAFVGSCLDSCTDNSDCAAVSFTTTGSAAAWSDRVNGCTLRRGTFDITSSWRSLVRTNAAAVTSVAIPTTPCTSCGSGINSEPTEPINVVALNDTGAGVSAVLLVSRSAASCYIEAGQGLVQASGSGSSSTPTYRLVNCTGNTFGAPNRTYGLDAKPCTSCPAGTSTASSTSADLRSSFGYISPEACSVPAGSGMTGAIATLCAKGTWNDGTTAPADRCKTCPTGTTTAGSSSTSSDACNLLSVGYEFLAVSNTVRLCSAGTYRDADTTGSTTIFTMSGATSVYSTSNVTCFSCPFGTTTFNGQLGTTGAVSAAECLVCPQGMGTPTSATPSGINQCAQCGGPSAAAAFGPLWRTANDTACPTNTNVYNFYYNGTNNPYSPPNIAPPSATDSSQCFVAYAQVVDANWYLNNSPSNMTACAAAGTDCHANLTACVGACTSDASCAFLSYNYAGAAGTTRCFFFRHTSISDTNRIAYKIMPTSASRRRSLHAALPKDQGSGVFSWWRASTTEAANVGVAITTFTTGTPSTTFVGTCLDSCTDNSDCAAVWFSATTTTTPWVNGVTACTLRQGTLQISSSWRSLVRTNAATVTTMAHPARPSRAFLLLALLALAGGAAAGGSGRRLLQGCPDGCSTDDGACVPGSDGTLRCTACLGNRVVARDGSCGCRKGSYLTSLNTNVNCTACLAGSYCPGGPQSASNITACGTGLTTRGQRTSSFTGCVNAAGYYYIKGSSGAPTAARCPDNSFSTGLRRQAACTPCPRGLKTDPTVLTDRTSAAVCKVPPGRFWTASSGAQRCPQGEYQTSYISPNAAAAACTPCPAGQTTSGPGSTSSSNCTGVAGYDGTDLCPQNFYCSGTTKSACPKAMWTRSVGAKNESDCMVPPGYSWDGTNSDIVKCTSGFQSNWTRNAVNCTLCGVGVGSEAVEPLSNFSATGSVISEVGSVFVRRTSASCYIERGQGLVQTSKSRAGTPVFKAVNCTSKNYGVANRTYGLVATPCTSCPEGTNTTVALGSGDFGYASADDCNLPSGYGMTGGIATLCAKGTWNNGTFDKCVSCDDGTTTAGNGSTSAADCSYLEAGYGYNGTLISLCPANTFGAERTFNTGNANECTDCPDGKVTLPDVVGAVDNSQCTFCPPGYGGSGLTCTSKCGNGTYGPDWRDANDYACVACAGPSNVYTFSWGGSNNPYASAPASPLGSTLPSQCMVGYAQVVNGKWFLDNGPLVADVALNLAACVAACTVDSGCSYISYNYNATSGLGCYLGKLTSGSAYIAFKIMPGSGLSRRSSGPADQGSGTFSWWNASITTGVPVGTPMSTADLGVATNSTTGELTTAVAASTCLEYCTLSPDCAAVYFPTGDLAATTTCRFLKGTKGAGRRLLQENITCPDGCATAACALDILTGIIRCTNCLNGRAPAVDGTCGCRPGRFLNSSSACEDCPVGSYCPGGTQAASRRYACNYNGDTAPPPPGTPSTFGLTTLRSRASARAQCVNQPGYYFIPDTTPVGTGGLTGTNHTAALCPANTFSPGLRRQAACTPCSAGLRTDPSDPVTGRTSVAVCKVAPGRYWGRAAIRCPRGEFRDGWATPGSVAILCTPCQSGVNTVSAGSTTAADCTVLLPGFFWGPPPSAGQAAALAPWLCSQGFYCAGTQLAGGAQPPAAQQGGGRVACPRGLWTRGRGTIKISDCLVPPGHFLPSGGEVTQCVNRAGAGDASDPANWGTYQPDWLAPADPKAAACRACGVGVMAGATDPVALFADSASTDDRVPTGVKLVSRSSASCYIRAGQGLLQDSDPGSAQPVMRAVTCGEGSYGVSGDSYGLTALPCASCPPGMATATLAVAGTAPARYFFEPATGGFTSPLACDTPPGWGLFNGQAMPCPQGTYNDPGDGSQGQCTACPDGTTSDPPTATSGGTSADACRWVVAGYGYVRPAGGASTAAIRSSIAPCAAGTYADSRRVIDTSADQPCTACPGGRTSSDDGATSAAECDSCPAGTGVQSPSTTCLPCPENTYGPDTRPGLTGNGTDTSGLACIACRAGAALYRFPWGGSNNFYLAPTVSPAGASESGQCMPGFAQITDGNWLLNRVNDAGMTAVPAGAAPPSLDACVAACGASCQFLTYDYSTQTCAVRAPAPGTSGSLIAFKVVADISGLAAAAAALPSDYGTGVFSWWRDDAPGQVGVPMAVSEGQPATFRGVSACLDACTLAPACAAVRFGVASGAVASCTLVKGQSTAGNPQRTLTDPSSALPRAAMARPARPSRAFLLLALLALAGGAAAGGSGRRLLQDQANCPDGCADGACVPAATGGGFRCTQCVNNRVVSRDGSCGCKPGFFLKKTDDELCSPCGKGNYCLGGSETASLAPGGQKSCNWNKDKTTEGLTTRSDRASSFTACVNAAGYYYIKGNDKEARPSAALCPADSFSPGLRRQAACTPCPKGLETDPGNTDPRKSSSVCLVKPGYFWTASSGAQRCPRGETRDGYLSPSNDKATQCEKCPVGSTTSKPGTASDCTEILPGYYLDGSNGNTPTLCPQSSYCPGGPKADKQACNGGMWTRSVGAKSETSCMVPPGYSFDNTEVKECDETSYQPDWVRPTKETSTVTCTPCGADVKSEAVEPLSKVEVDDPIAGTVKETLQLVRRTSASCYIEPGQGLVQASVSGAGKPVFEALTCDGNNYGAAKRTYGLVATPCTSCPAGTTTAKSEAQKSGGYASAEDCLVPAGWGMTGAIATLCAKGSWNDGKTEPADKCKACADGTTTEGDSSMSADGCRFLEAGYGSFKGDEGFVVAPCRANTYADKERKFDSGAEMPCEPCPMSSATLPGVVGASDATQCSICPAGWGSEDINKVDCKFCPSGTYGPDWRNGGDTKCVACAGPSNVYTFNYGGTNNPFRAGSASPEGAVQPSQCLVGYAQVVNDKWFLTADPKADPRLKLVAKDGNLDECVKICTDQAENCQYVSYDYSKKQCWLRLAAGGLLAIYEDKGLPLVAFKIMPGSGLARRASAAPADQGSGRFSWWADEAGGSAGTRMAKVDLVNGVTTDGEGMYEQASPTQCLAYCTRSPDCAAVFFPDGEVHTDSNPVRCMFLRGTAGVQISPWRSLLRTVAGSEPKALKA
ncbi:hypothetical protein HT031_006073 [Scenedesmus sp. PABB004]|nr:hypothetical protein HT031_006073 [Scenedesmus sp. PABB004]